MFLSTHDTLMRFDDKKKDDESSFDFTGHFMKAYTIHILEIREKIFQDTQMLGDGVQRNNGWFIGVDFATLFRYMRVLKALVDMYGACGDEATALGHRCQVSPVVAPVSFSMQCFIFFGVSKSLFPCHSCKLQQCQHVLPSMYTIGLSTPIFLNSMYFKTRGLT